MLKTYIIILDKHLIKRTNRTEKHLVKSRKNCKTDFFLQVAKEPNSEE